VRGSKPFGGLGKDKDMGKWIAAMRQSALWERVAGKSTGRRLGIKIVCYKGLQESCTIK